MRQRLVNVTFAVVMRMMDANPSAMLIEEMRSSAIAQAGRETIPPAVCTSGRPEQTANGSPVVVTVGQADVNPPLRLPCHLPFLRSFTRG